VKLQASAITRTGILVVDHIFPPYHWKVPQNSFRLNRETEMLNSYSTTPIHWPFEEILVLLLLTCFNYAMWHFTQRIWGGGWLQ